MSLTGEGGSAVPQATTFLPCIVISYSGHKGDERPSSVRIDGRTIDLFAMRTSRIEEDARSRERKRYFTAQGSDGVEYVFRHDCTPDRWYVAVVA